MELSRKVKKRIEANRIVGYMLFRDHFSSHPGKHSWNLCGHPVYYWQMKAAVESKYLEKIILWTEVEEAWKLARKMSDKFVVIKRKLEECKEPEWETVDDLKTPTSRVSLCPGGPGESRGIPLIKKTLRFSPTIVYLTVCFPLITSEDIDKLIEKYFEDDIAERAYLVSRVEARFYTCNVQNPQYLFPIWNFPNMRRQDFSPLYKLTGVRIISYTGIGRNRWVYVEIPPERAVDIHDKKDLELAKFYLGKRLRQNQLAKIMKRKQKKKEITGLKNKTNISANQE